MPDAGPLARLREFVEYALDALGPALELAIMPLSAHGGHKTSATETDR